MTIANLNCDFHPSRYAITKCEHCGKLLCVECKNIYKESHSYSSGNTSSYYCTQHELCTPCYYNKKINRYDPMGPLIIIFFGFIFLVASIFMLVQSIDFVTSWNSPNIPPPTVILLFGIIFVVIAIGLIINGIVALILAPGKKRELKAKKEAFYESVLSLPYETIDDIPKKYTCCPLCGAQDDLNAKYCSKCGSILDIVS